MEVPTREVEIDRRVWQVGVYAIRDSVAVDDLFAARATRYGMRPSLNVVDSPRPDYIFCELDSRARSQPP
jgi:hypothetical protein